MITEERLLTQGLNELQERLVHSERKCSAAVEEVYDMQDENDARQVRETGKRGLAIPYKDIDAPTSVDCRVAVGRRATPGDGGDAWHTWASLGESK